MKQQRSFTHTVSPDEIQQIIEIKHGKQKIQHSERTKPNVLHSAVESMSGEK